MNSHVDPTGFNPGRGIAGVDRRVSSGSLTDAWSAFAGARTASDFCRSWLALQCGMISGAVAALLLLEEDNGRYAAAAAWPDPSRDMAYLAPAAEQALAERRGVARKANTGKTDRTDSNKADAASPARHAPALAASHLAYPIDVGGRLYGVVAVDMGAASPAALQAALRQLLWGVGWLEAMFRRRQNEEDQAKLDRSAFAMDILAGASEQRAFKASALDVANELAARLNCRRVAIGLARKDEVRLAALSHSAVTREKAQTVAAMLNAMEECYDQSAPVAWPATEATETVIALAHRDLAKLSGADSVCSAPMTSAGRRVGVITLEREGAEAFDARSIQLIEAVAALIGPLLEMKAGAERLIAGRAADKTASGLAALFGPRRPALKLAALALVAGVAALSLMNGDYRVAAKAVVEGAVQRAAVAPFEGFLAEAPARAGDVVDEGQLIAALDDREIRLEAVRWKSDLEQQRLKYNDALGKHDRPAARVAAAQIEQSAAQLAQVEDRLVRARVTAPFRAVIVSGDLSQSIGSPVEKGKTLFELAPLDAYRVILQIDERDVADVEKGQQGTLLLTSLASDPIPFTVKTITPVATAQDGKNHFRAEADLKTAIPLKPGMEGVAKVQIDRRNLIAIYAKPITDWFKLTVWKYAP